MEVGVVATAHAVHADIALDAGQLGAAEGRLRVSGDELQVGHPVLVDAELAVGTQHAVVAIRQFAVGEHHAHAVLTLQVTVGTEHADSGFLAVEWIRCGTVQARGLVVHQDGAEAPLTSATGQTQSAFGVNDAAGKQQDRVGGEEVCVLHEERATLGVLHFEALVDGDLRLVRLDLREVRIQCQVQHPGIVEHELGIDAHVVFLVAFHQRAACSAGVDRLDVSCEQEWHDLRVAAGRDIADASHHCGLVQTTVNADGVGWPEAFLAQAWNLAAGLHAPHLVLRIGETQTAQWHADADHVALLVHFAVAVPHGFPGGVETGAVREAFRPAGIPLHAQRGDAEGVGGALVVEGIDGQLDGVVAADVLAGREVGADLRRVGVEGQEHGIQRAFVIAQVDLGALGRRGPIGRFTLDEILHLGHLPRQGGRGRHAGEVAERGFLRDERDGNAGGGVCCVRGCWQSQGERAYEQTGHETGYRHCVLSTGIAFVWCLLLVAGGLVAPLCDRGGS